MHHSLLELNPFETQYYLGCAYTLHNCFKTRFPCSDDCDECKGAVDWTIQQEFRKAF